MRRGNVIVGAMNSKCKLCILMGKISEAATSTTATTSTRKGAHKQQSMILVPMDTAGVKVLRHLSVFGFDDAPCQ